MINIGDKVTFDYNPWSQKPGIAIKTIVSDIDYDKLNEADKFFHLPISYALIQSHNKRFTSQKFERNNIGHTPIITHIKIKNIKNMSEVTKPMKTEKDIHDLDYITRMQKLFNIKVESPEILKPGMQCLKWEVHKSDEIKSQQHPTVVDITTENINDIILHMEADKINSVFIRKRHVLPSKKKPKSKKAARRISRANDKELKDIIKNTHNAHKPKCVELGLPKIQGNKKTTYLNKYVVQVKNKGYKLYKTVKAHNPKAVYDRFYKRYEGASLLIREWHTPEARAWRRKPVRKAPSPLQQPNPNLHKRMVCIKHSETSEVRRLEWYKANKLISIDTFLHKSPLWAFCEKWEWKNYVNVQHTHLFKTEHGTGIQPNSTFSRSNGTRVRKVKGTPGHRHVKSQLIKISTLPKDEIDEDGSVWEILTKKKLITYKKPIYRYVTFPQICSLPSDRSPFGTILGHKTIKFCAGYETITKEIEYTPIQKFVYKTIKVYRPLQKQKVVKTTKQEAAIAKDNAPKKKSTSRDVLMKNKLYKKRPHLTAKEKIKFKRMFKQKLKK